MFIKQNYAEWYSWTFIASHIMIGATVELISLHSRYTTAFTPPPSLHSSNRLPSSRLYSSKFFVNSCRDSNPFALLCWPIWNWSRTYMETSVVVVWKSCSWSNTFNRDKCYMTKTYVALQTGQVNIIFWESSGTIRDDRPSKRVHHIFQPFNYFPTFFIIFANNLLGLPE